MTRLRALGLLAVLPALLVLVIAASALMGLDCWRRDREGDEGLLALACACVVLREGASLTLTDVSGYMAENTVAKNYWPERIEVLDALPKTPSGKVQKFKLREIVNAPK